MSERQRGTKGMGSIFPLPDGSWRAQLDLGIIGGKRIRKTRTCRPPNAQTKARRALVELRRRSQFHTRESNHGVADI